MNNFKKYFRVFKGIPFLNKALKLKTGSENGSRNKNFARSTEEC